MKWKFSLFILLLLAALPLKGGEYLRYEELLKFKKIYMEGKSFYNSGEYKTALNFFLQLQEKEEKLPPKVRKFVRYYIAESYFHLKLYSGAKEQFIWLINHPPVPFRDRVYRRIEEINYLTDAIDEFEKFFPDAITSASRYKDELFYLKGRILLQKKEYERAEEYFKRIKEKSAWFIKGKYFQGYALTGMGKLEKAISVWESILKIFPEKDRLLLNLGILCRKVGDLKKAENYFSEITDGSEAKEEALYDLAWIQLDQNKLGDALQTLKELAKRYPQSKRLGEVSLLIGYIYLALGKYVESYRYFDATQNIFSGMEKRMKLFRKTHGVPEEFYEALLYPAPGEVTLPSTISRWILEDRYVKLADNFIGDVKNLKVQIEDIKYFIHDLALKALSPENEKRSPAYLDIETLEDMRALLIQLLSRLLELKAKPLENYMYREEALILDRIRYIREELIEMEKTPENVEEKIDEKRREIENLRKYILTLNPDVLEGRESVQKGNLKVKIPFAEVVLEKFYREIDKLTLMSLDLFSLRFWIKETINYTFLLQDKMIDIILFRLGIYQDKRYPFFIQASDIFTEGWGLLSTITSVEHSIARIEKKNFLTFYSKAISQEAELNTFLATLDQLNEMLTRVRGGLAMESFARIENYVHNTSVKHQLGKINVVWRSKEYDEKLSLRLLNEKEKLKEKIDRHYRWIVEPTHKPVPEGYSPPEMADYLKMLSLAESKAKNSIYTEQLKELGDAVSQLITQYYRVKEVIKRMETNPLQ